MEAIKIEILNPKALTLIKGMQELDLIRVSEAPASRLKSYLKKMRQQSASVPSPDEIAKMAKEVRVANHAKK
jgi:hypothetical protein